MFSCKSWTSTKFVRSELTVELWLHPNMGGNDTKVHFSNKTEIWLTCFELILSLNGMKMTWYSACLLLLFLFKTNVKKRHLGKNNSRHCYGNFFFESGILKVAWSQLYSKPLLINHKAPWQEHFARHPNIIKIDHVSLVYACFSLEPTILAKIFGTK